MLAANDQPEDPDYTLPRIIDGAFDDYLHQYAKDIATLGLPLGIRLDHEMNSSWYPWAEKNLQGTSNNGNRPGDYVAMWRHVHDIFEAEGANQYVALDLGAEHRQQHAWLAGGRLVPEEPLPGRRRTSTGSACPATTARPTRRARRRPSATRSTGRSPSSGP